MCALLLSDCADGAVKCGRPANAGSLVIKENIAKPIRVDEYSRKTRLDYLEVLFAVASQMALPSNLSLSPDVRHAAQWLQVAAVPSCPQPPMCSSRTLLPPAFKLRPTISIGEYQHRLAVLISHSRPAQQPLRPVTVAAAARRRSQSDDVSSGKQSAGSATARTVKGFKRTSDSKSSRFAVSDMALKQ